MTTILSEIHGGVLHLRLNRPEHRNAIDDEMFAELGQAAESARDNTDISAIVLSGEGKSFCAGLDFSVHQKFADEGASGATPYADPDDPQATGRTPGRGQRIVRALRDAPVPVIAALHGHAIGGGMQIALGADIRLSTADARLGCAEINFGMTVDMGASQLLPRLIGADRTMEMLLTGRLMTGTEAYQLGMVTQLADDPLAAALGLAESIADRSRVAVVETKRLVGLAESGTVADGMKEELRVLARNVGSPAQVAAVEKYFARRNAR